VASFRKGSEELAYARARERSNRGSDVPEIDGFEDTPAVSNLAMRIPEGVELVKSAEPARWALERTASKEPPEWTLSTFMPDGYDGYLRILHPLADRGGDGPWFRWRDFARPESLPIQPDAQLQDVVGADSQDQRWLDDHGPSAGSMSSNTCASLIAVLRRFTATPDLCWMAVWDGWGVWWPPVSMTPAPNADPSEISTTRARGFRRAWEQHERIEAATADIEFIERPWGRRYFLFRAPIERAESLHGRTPQLWWPDDRTWFVSTEVDGYSSYVGASRDCLDALSTSDALEAIDVPWDVRLDAGR
jgi:hypothetical protein